MSVSWGILAKRLLVGEQTMRFQSMWHLRIAAILLVGTSAQQVTAQFSAGPDVYQADYQRLGAPGVVMSYGDVATYSDCTGCSEIDDADSNNCRCDQCRKKNRSDDGLIDRTVRAAKGNLLGSNNNSNYCVGCEGSGPGCADRMGILGLHGPQGSGRCCHPRWYDVHFEFMYLTRDRASRPVEFSSDGAAGLGTPDVVLGSENLDFADEPGLRATIAYLWGPGTNLEATFMGGFDWSTRANEVSGSDNLYSAFSDFGTTPIGGYLESDQAAEHSLLHESTLNSIELNLRRRNVSRNCRVHTSWLLGLRYLKVEDDFRFLSVVEAHDDPLTGTVDSEERGPAELDYDTDATNDLLGFQIGVNSFLCTLPGFLVGGELKAGIYGNHAQQETAFDFTRSLEPIAESLSDTDVAGVFEASFIAIYKVTSRFTLRGGYHVMYLEGVALGLENFDSTPPSIFVPPAGENRTVSLNHNGSILLHGFTAGLEWTW